MRTYTGPEYKISKLADNVVFSLNTNNGSIQGPHVVPTALSNQQESRGSAICNVTLFDSKFQVSQARVKIMNESVGMNMITASTTKTRLIYSFFQNEHTITTRTQREAMNIIRNRIRTQIFDDMTQYMTIYGYMEKVIQYSLDMTAKMILSTDSYTSSKQTETCVIACKTSKLFHIYAHCNTQHHIYTLNSLVTGVRNENLISALNAFYMAEWMMLAADHVDKLSAMFGVKHEGITEFIAETTKTYEEYYTRANTEINRMCEENGLSRTEIPKHVLAPTAFSIIESTESEPELKTPLRNAKKSISDYVLK